MLIAMFHCNGAEGTKYCVVFDHSALTKSLVAPWTAIDNYVLLGENAVSTNTSCECRTTAGAGLAGRSLAWIAAGRLRARARRELLGLDEYLLRDIGLTHDQVLYGDWQEDAHSDRVPPKRALQSDGTAFRILVTVLIAAASILLLALKQGLDGAHHAALAPPTACTGVDAVLTANGLAPKDQQYCAVPGKNLPAK
jgi:uncharacterized protein YjiS (DUF1127 family)